MHEYFVTFGPTKFYQVFYNSFEDFLEVLE